ncbi:MAG: N-6 DNA methylase [Chloroflexi bacterium]|nr:N-6 DNA methylase [Chloroflexota bacterium]
MIDSQDLQQILLNELGYSNSGGLAPASWGGKRPIESIDSAYIVNGTTVLYFSQLSDPGNILRLYQKVWNHNKTPLLYVILPGEIRVYNIYDEPVRTNEELAATGRLLRHLQQLEKTEDARQQIRDQLNLYDRLHLDTGAFWTTSDGLHIKKEKRADQRLLRAVDQARRHLLDLGLTNELAYALIGRSVFVSYLEDREVLTQKDFSDLTNGRISKYEYALQDIKLTYDLFKQLDHRFGGDIFPVRRGERSNIRKEHLKVIRDFLEGTDLDTGQLSFWPYDFKYIPIELISGIYDTFLNIEERQIAGTYYTPAALVDFILDQTMPPSQVQLNMRILDQACGSGIFLVRAYERIIEAWQRQNKRRATGQELATILKNSIFGVDKEPEAIQVAAFNLHLAVLDYLDNSALREQEFVFPSLVDSNLLIGNFFSTVVQKRLSDQKFDRVVGNPPWGRGKLTADESAWLKSRNRIVGGKQIAQVFMLAASEHCSENGEIALLAPANGTILVTSDTHRAFRAQFFSEYDVRAVVNFSALVYELFAESLNPSVAIFYKPRLPQSTQRIVYAVPKPSSLSQQLGAIVIDGTEIKYLDREEIIEEPVLWKVALWGSARDAALIRRLKSLPTLKEQADELGWHIEEGIQLKGKQYAPWLKGRSFIRTDFFRRYTPDPNSYQKINQVHFHRSHNPEIFKGPLALIHESPLEGRCAAAFIANDVVYLHMVSGVRGNPGQEDLLKWLVAYVNSPLAGYYHFLTSTRWGIERGIILNDEYKQMPFIVPKRTDPLLEEVVRNFDQISAILQESDRLAVHQADAIQEHEETIANLIFEAYGLTSIERQLVKDLEEFGIGFFYWSKKKTRKPNAAPSVRRPDPELLKNYAETFVDSVNTLLKYQNQTLNATVIHNHAPLSVVGFDLVNLNEKRPVQIINDAEELFDLLRHLDNLLVEPRNISLFMRRHVRVYDNNRMYLVRPSERRFWSQSQARVDSDDVMAEWLSYSRERDALSHA